MIPVIIGATLAAGVGVGFALDKNDKPNNVTQKAEVSEDYVKWQLNSAKRDLRETPTQSSEIKFIKSNDFNEDLEQIKNLLDNPNVDTGFISDALNSIEQRARSFGNEKAINLVEYYRYKLLYR